MDPIRPPRRARVRRRDPLAFYLLAAVAFFAGLIAGARQLATTSPPVSPIGVMAEPASSDHEPMPAVAAPTPRLIYQCDGATGVYRQDRPCPTANRPSAVAAYREASPPSAAIDPNRSLLDAADARYAREVARAQSSSGVAARQVARSSFVAGEDGDGSALCSQLCADLQNLRSRMRSGYGAAEGSRLHAWQNRIFQDMSEAHCHACF